MRGVAEELAQARQCKHVGYDFIQALCRETEVTMLCAELEKLEAEFDDILTSLENPNLTEQEKQDLRDAYARMSQTISDHQKYGHEGHPCFEE